VSKVRSRGLEDAERQAARIIKRYLKAQGGAEMGFDFGPHEVKLGREVAEAIDRAARLGKAWR
jgi:hypothetical protein